MSDDDVKSIAAEARRQVDAIFDHLWNPEDYPVERQMAADEYCRQWGDRDVVDVERWLDMFYSNEQRPAGHFIDACERRKLLAERERLVAIVNAAGDLIDIVYKETPDELEKFRAYEQALAALGSE